jgi:hypothetical protein
MFERLSNNDITNALDELIACFGVSGEVPFNDLVTLLDKKDTERCVQEIATRLGLPIRISLSYVPKDFSLGSTDGFLSSALARTDRTGCGIEGITAQVSIPQDLPMFGTAGLQGYPIRVRVSENCHAHPDTFVQIMAHELSHVLLASLWSPHKDSELHADLVPILLGFRDVVRRGRKTIERTTSGNTITTHTTTYGYLTDAQFEFACNYVTELLQRHARDKKRLLELVDQVQREIKKAARSLATFRDYFRYLDSHPPEKMRTELAQRVVDLHTQDYSLDWESRVTTAKTAQGAAESFVRSLNRYTSSAVKKLKNHTRVLELASDDLSQVIEAITKDTEILRRYVPIIYRLRRTLWGHS